MKKNNLIKVCGSLTKKESLVSVNYNILKNTCVAEANIPYPGYYGAIPGQASPNSLFLFTSNFFSLEEVLRFAQNINSCYMEKVNVAAASLEMADHKYFAIRVKYFPDYEHIHLLQGCCIKEGVEFAKKVRIFDFGTVRVNKCFVLEELEEGIYLDKNEEHKGYIIIPRQITKNEFLNILINIRNNTDCKLFDAAMGGMIIESQAKDIVRIYSEKINIELLKCIQERFKKLILKE
jgi:hypothetical protein